MQQEKSHRMPLTILSQAFILSFAMYAPMFCVPPMEHILKAELNLTHAQTSLLFTAPMLMIVVVAIPAGLIADKIGFKKAAGIGAIIMAAGTILRGTATNASSLLAFTFLYGFGFGWSFPNLPKLVSAWVPREKAGVATGIFTAGLSAGGALALAITMPLIYPITNTFQGVFYVWSIPPIIAAILWWVLVKEPPRINTPVEVPIKNRTPFRQVIQNKNLWMVSILLLLNEVFFQTWAGWAPALTMLKGAAPEQAGLISSITIWVAIPAALLMPRLAYGIGLRKPFIWIPSLILAFVAWRAIGISLSKSWILMAMVGIVDTTRYATILSLPVEIMSEKEVGTGSGVVLSIGHLGGIVGPYMGGYVLDRTGSLDLALLLLTGVSIAMFGIALKLPETGPLKGIKEYIYQRRRRQYS
ncbi:CynX/NimT family MFS transporter [Chloroflexota bacterium]